MRRIAIFMAALALAALLGAGEARAQGKWTDNQKKLMAKEAAIADAYRKLAEQVKGLQIDAQTYVRDFVAQSDEINKSVSAFIRFAKVGQPKYYDDGICEVEASLTLETVITELEKICNGVYKGDKFKGEMFQKIHQYVKTDLITAKGNSAIATAEDEGAGAAAGAGGKAPLPARGGRNRGFWAKVPAKYKLMAKEAATADCYRKIAEQIKGVRIDATTYVRDFVAESDEINKAVSANLRWVKLDEPKWLEDGIVEVHGSVKLEYIITTLDEIVRAKFKGDKVKIDKWQQINQEVKSQLIEATGSGTTSYGQKEGEGEVAEPTDKGMVDEGEVIPAWARERYTAVGKGAMAADENLSEARRKMKAERAALVDGQRKLLEYIKGLRVSSRTTVNDFATENDEIRTQIDGVIRGSRQEGEPKWSEDGICEVKVVLDLSELWKILQAQAKLKRGAVK